MKVKIYEITQNIQVPEGQQDSHLLVLFLL